MSQDRITGSTASEMLVFMLGAQEFCVDVMVVREIRGWAPAVPLPHSAAYMYGVINLRGAVLPVVDLAARLALPAEAPHVRNVIIVVEVGTKVIGLLVHAVSGILDIRQETLQETPSMASGSARACVQGILAKDGRMISVLSLDGTLDLDGDFATAA